MYMFKYILKRLGLGIFVFTASMLICFVLIKTLPIPIGDGLGKDRELLEANLRARGYYDPIMKQLWDYVVRIFTKGDFGIGTTMPGFVNKPVWDSFVKAMPPTVLINIYSSLIGVPIGLGLGIFAALKKNKWQDQIISTGVMVFVSIPTIVYAFLIQYLLCFKWDLFPLMMANGTDYLSWEMFYSMMPAILAFSLGSIARYARYTRAELTEVLTSEFMLLARTKGLTKGQAVIRHAMRNSMVPIFPMLLGEFIGVLGGSLVIEKYFSIPGLGAMYLNSINSLDYDFFMMLSGFSMLVGVLAGIVVDISYGIVDPRIRMGAR